MKTPALIVAHRGASRDAPENTLPAFKLAWEQGADAIEGDFHLTQDGQIVCIHDADTRNVADATLPIKDSSFLQLRKLDVGSYFSEKYKGTVIPSAAEVFATVPDQKKIYIEIKSDESIIPNLLAEIQKSGLKNEQVIIISFDERVLHSIKIQAPCYKTLWLASFKITRFGKIIPSIPTILATLSRIQADGFSSGKKFTTQRVITKIKEAGYEYHVWTVDDVHTAKRLMKWGAQSITTNRPGVMKRNPSGWLERFRLNRRSSTHPVMNPPASSNSPQQRL